jgi:signal transduction histidine kinase
MLKKIVTNKSIRKVAVKNDKSDLKLDKNFFLDDAELADFNKRIMDNAPVSIITINREGYITSANKYFKTFSRTKDFHKDNIFSSEFFIREKLVDDYRKLLTEGVVIRRENCYEKNSKGEDKYLKIIAVPLFDKAGKIDGALSMAIDNTEAYIFRNELEKLNHELEKMVAARTLELNKANDDLEEVLKLKSMFMADISHEMRTSLAIIQGNTELISCGLVADLEQVETYEQVFGEIKRISMMLADLTLLSNPTVSRQRLDYEKINLNSLISSSCGALKLIANENRIKIIQGDKKGRVELMADSKQLERLLLNLLKNAIKYNQENGWIKVWAKENGKNVILSVQDSGIGISKEDLKYVFERFYRADKSRTRKEGGSGLGLAICKWIAQIHGGKIEVESVPGKGSLFTVTLPKVMNNRAK